MTPNEFYERESLNNVLYIITHSGRFLMAVSRYDMALSAAKKWAKELGDYSEITYHANLSVEGDCVINERVYKNGNKTGAIYLPDETPNYERIS